MQRLWRFFWAGLTGITLLCIQTPVVKAQSGYYTQVTPLPPNSPYYKQYTPQQSGIYISPAVPIQQPTAVMEAIKSPQQILSELKRANNIPDTAARNIQVVHSSALNAATNGRDIIITDALLNRLGSNDERAFIIGHELSHIVLDHVAKSQVRNMGLNLLNRYVIPRFTNQSGLAQLASQLGLGLIAQKSSRDYEYQADDLGFRLMTTAGYRPTAAIQVFNTLSQSGTGSRSPEFLQDHPLTSSRIQALVRKYQIPTQ